ncbi:MAG: hypothetical protein NTV22_14345 [bacterium]|nr:hypothetical protein [bacterium]
MKSKCFIFILQLGAFVNLFILASCMQSKETSHTSQHRTSTPHENTNIATKASFVDCDHNGTQRTMHAEFDSVKDRADIFAQDVDLMSLSSSELRQVVCDNISSNNTDALRKLAVLCKRLQMFDEAGMITHSMLDKCTNAKERDVLLADLSQIHFVEAIQSSASAGSPLLERAKQSSWQCIDGFRERPLEEKLPDYAHVVMFNLVSLCCVEKNADALLDMKTQFEQRLDMDEATINHNMPEDSSYPEYVYLRISKILEIGDAKASNETLDNVEKYANSLPGDKKVPGWFSCSSTEGGEVQTIKETLLSAVQHYKHNNGR